MVTIPAGITPMMALRDDEVEFLAGSARCMGCGHLDALHTPDEWPECLLTECSCVAGKLAPWRTR